MNKIIVRKYLRKINYTKMDEFLHIVGLFSLLGLLTTIIGDLEGYLINKNYQRDIDFNALYVYRYVMIGFLIAISIKFLKYLNKICGILRMRLKEKYIYKKFTNEEKKNN